VPKINPIRSTDSIEHRLVTDRQTDRHRAIAIVLALAQRRAGKNNSIQSTACRPPVNSLLPRNAMLARYMLSSCIRPLQVGIVSKRLDESTWGPIYKISYNLSQDYLKFVVRSTYDSDLKRAKISFRNIVS